MAAPLHRGCEGAQAPGQAWRCFFAAAAWRHLATPVLFHEYLYDSANLGYDGAGPAQYGDFRRRLEASFAAPEQDGNSSSGGGGGGLEAVAAERHGEGSSAGGGGEGGDASGLRGATLQAPLLLPTSVAGLQAGAPTPAPANGTGSRQLSGERPNMFSPACHLHEMIDGVQFTTSHVGGRRLVDVLAAWFGGSVDEVFLIDEYEGVRGSDKCGVDPAAAAGLSAAQFYTKP